MSVVSNTDILAGQGGIAAVGSTATQIGTDQTNPYGRGIKAFVNMVAVGTGSVTVAIQGKDQTSGLYFTILASAAIVANGTTVLTVYPGLTAAANAVANDVLPRTWRILATANNANPASYTVGASVIV